MCQLLFRKGPGNYLCGHGGGPGGSLRSKVFERKSYCKKHPDNLVVHLFLKTFSLLYLGKIPILTNIFVRGWNHLAMVCDVSSSFDLDLMCFPVVFDKLFPYIICGKSPTEKIPAKVLNKVQERFEVRYRWRWLATFAGCTKEIALDSCSIFKKISM